MSRMCFAHVRKVGPATALQATFQLSPLQKHGKPVGRRYSEFVQTRGPVAAQLAMLQHADTAREMLAMGCGGHRLGPSKGKKKQKKGQSCHWLAPHR